MIVKDPADATDKLIKLWKVRSGSISFHHMFNNYQEDFLIFVNTIPSYLELLNGEIDLDRAIWNSYMNRKIDNYKGWLLFSPCLDNKNQVLHYVASRGTRELSEYEVELEQYKP